MTIQQPQKTPKQTKVVEKTAVHPLLEHPVGHAYALIPAPGRPGRYFAVHLSQVFAEQLEYLEPSKRPEPALYGLGRIEAAMAERHYRKEWDK